LDLNLKLTRQVLTVHTPCDANTHSSCWQCTLLVESADLNVTLMLTGHTPIADGTQVLTGHALYMLTVHTPETSNADRHPMC
jgi:hypothetical protein